MKKRDLKARVKELEQRVAELEHELEIARNYAEMMRTPHIEPYTVPSPEPSPYVVPYDPLGPRPMWPNTGTPIPPPSWIVTCNSFTQC